MTGAGSGNPDRGGRRRPGRCPARVRGGVGRGAPGGRAEYVRERGGRYDEEIQRAMMGMSSTEWSRYLHETAGVHGEPEAINDDVVRRMLEAYRSHLPLIDGAADAVRRLAARYTLG